MNRNEREQRQILADAGVTVERERPAKGGHKMLYCVGPNGRKFVALIQMGNTCTRGWLNFRANIKRLTTD